MKKSSSFCYISINLITEKSMIISIFLIMSLSLCQLNNEKVWIQIMQNISSRDIFYRILVNHQHTVYINTGSNYSLNMCQPSQTLFSSMLNSSKKIIKFPKFYSSIEWGLLFSKLEFEIQYNFWSKQKIQINFNRPKIR